GSAWKSFDDLSATLGEAGAAAHFTDSMKGAVMHELARFLFGGLGAQKTNRFWTRSPSQHELLAGELPADFATAKIKTGAVVDRARRHAAVGRSDRGRHGHRLSAQRHRRQRQRGERHVARSRDEGVRRRWTASAFKPSSRASGPPGSASPI